MRKKLAWRKNEVFTERRDSCRRKKLTQREDHKVGRMEFAVRAKTYTEIKKPATPIREGTNMIMYIKTYYVL